MKKSAEKGFTLAELLIALGILGVIAAFTIPKVLQATGQSQNSAAARDAVSTLEQVWYNAKLQSQLTNGVSLYANTVGNPNANGAINALAQAATDPGAAATDPYGAIAHPCEGAAFIGWVQFHNGTIISGLAHANSNVPAGGIANNMAAGSNTALCIDANGAAGPNVAGTDIFYGTFNPSGNFDAGGVFNSVNAITNKNFFWGTNTNGFAVYGTGAAANGAPAFGANAGAGRLMQ